MKKILAGTGIVLGLVAFLPVHSPDLPDSANDKAQAIVESTTIGQFQSKGLTIEIKDISQIEGGVELHLQAWRGGQQIGFGSDGSVDIERFRIFNPPILVDDPNGNIVRTIVSPEGATRERRLREDPAEALRQVLTHSVSVVAKDGSNIQRGKVGNTTDTYFSDTGGDGFIQAQHGTYSTVHDATAGDTAFAGNTTMQWGQQFRNIDNNYYLWRAYIPFDTSSIPDTNAVSSATLSIFGTSKTDTLGVAPVTTVVASTQASSTAIDLGDWDQLGTTSLGTIAYADYSTSAYNDITLNATGIAAISKTGFTKLGLRTDRDISSTAPAVGGNNIENVHGNAADQGGTTNDPKLVITHDAAAAATFTPRVIWFL